MSSSYRLALNSFLAGLSLEADLLCDIGGSQVSLKERVKSFNVKRLLIADLPEPHENSPKPDIELDLNQDFFRNAGGNGIQNDGKRSFDIDIFNEVYQKCDIVTCFEVMDYVWHAPNAFMNIASLLKPGGTAYVSAPSFYPLHQPIEDDALRYMPAAIYKLADYAGLEVVEMVKRRPETDLFEQFYRAERMRAAKHQDHKFTGIIATFRKKI